MTREQRLMRLFRSLSDDTQEDLGRALGVSRALVSQIERGVVVPDPAYLETAARRAGIWVADGDELLRLHDTMRRSRERWGLAPESLFDSLTGDLRTQLDAAYRRLLTLPEPEPSPQPEDRERAEELFRLLLAEPAEVRPAIVRAAEEFHTWAVAVRLCAAAEQAAGEDAERWAFLARLAADRVDGPEGFRSRLQGYAAAHQARALRAAGDLDAANQALEEAERLWTAGDDPYGVLPPHWKDSPPR